MSYTVVYYSNRHKPVVHKVSTLQQAQELARIGKDKQYLVDIEDDNAPVALPEWTD